MKRLITTFGVALLVSMSAIAQPDDRRVAVTLDDGPLLRIHAQPSLESAEQAVDGLLEALAAHNAPATLFVVGLKIERHPEFAVPLIERWIEGGVEIGNHTHRHLSVDRLGTEAFVADIDRAKRHLDPILEGRHQDLRYFRAPYLQEGSTSARQSGLASGLEQRGLRNAPVTIAIEDWRFNDRYEEAERAGDWWQRAEIGNAYLEHARRVIDEMTSLGRTVADREVAHVLLLHANTINRDFLEPILDHLASRGFEFIDLDEAYRDPIYATPLPPSEEGSSVLVRLAQAQGLLAER